MPPKLALLFGIAFVVYAWRSDRKREGGDPKGLLWPTLWYIVVAARPPGFWLTLWGIPVPGSSADPTEGNVVDRYVYAVLTIIGLRVLAKRNFSWRDALTRNQWLGLFLAFMAASILWSQYPFVSFKRYIKLFGSVVMAFVILTHDRPLEAISAVLRRCLYIHLPMSIICTRYFREIGVSFDWGGGTTYWNGIATSKNTLGQIAMLGVVYFFWEVRSHWRTDRWRNVHVLYLLMSAYLLKGSENSTSMTSVSVCAFALLVFLGIQRLRERPSSVRTFVLTIFSGTAALIVLVQIHSVVMFAPDSIFGTIITAFGRDITLTDRTFIWSDVYAANHNALFGVGYGGFWIGRLVNIPWNAHMTWVLGQAHSGYVDNYLQLGLVGDFLLAAVICSSMPKLLACLHDDFDLGAFRVTLFLTILFVNITESVYLRGDHHLWLLFMVVLWEPPKLRPTDEGSTESSGLAEAQRQPVLSTVRRRGHASSLNRSPQPRPVPTGASLPCLEP